MYRMRIGPWTPGEINPALLIVELLLVTQAASRGMDYVLPRPDRPTPPSLSAVEAALPLPLWGWAFMVLAGMCMVGLAAGWPLPLWIGHLGLSALYCGFAWGLMLTVPVVSAPRAVLGLILLTGGILMLVGRWRRRDWLRALVALLAIGVGGWVTGYALGYDFRSATGLLSAAGSHAAFGVGIAVLARRQHDVTAR